MRERMRVREGEREREAHENNETRETNYNWCSEFHDQKMMDVLSRKYCTYQLVEAHRQKLLERGSPSYRSAFHAHCGHAHLVVVVVVVVLVLVVVVVLEGVME